MVPPTPAPLTIEAGSAPFSVSPGQSVPRCVLNSNLINTCVASIGVRRTLVIARSTTTALTPHVYAPRLLPRSDPGLIGFASTSSDDDHSASPRTRANPLPCRGGRLTSDIHALLSVEAWVPASNTRPLPASSRHGPWLGLEPG
jgi:hypothetical protein